MDQKLAQELTQKDKENKAVVKQVTEKVAAETKQLEETKKAQEISQIENQNEKKVKSLTGELKEKQAELDTSTDKATQTMNKLNDVQAAAWFKDQKIK